MHRPCVLPLGYPLLFTSDPSPGSQDTCHVVVCKLSLALHRNSVHRNSRGLASQCLSPLAGQASRKQRSSRVHDLQNGGQRSPVHIWMQLRCICTIGWPTQLILHAAQNSVPAPQRAETEQLERNFPQNQHRTKHKGGCWPHTLLVIPSLLDKNKL